MDIADQAQDKGEYPVFFSDKMSGFSGAAGGLGAVMASAFALEIPKN